MVENVFLSAQVHKHIQIQSELNNNSSSKSSKRARVLAKTGASVVQKIINKHSVIFGLRNQDPQIR